jgi:release factor glutamine methyltransferase
MNAREAILEAVEPLAAAGIADAWANAAFLMQHLPGMDTLDASLERPLQDWQVAKYRAWIAQREQRVPAQYVTGRQPFMGLSIAVSPDVFIPRPYTESFVTYVVERLPSATEVNVVVAEIGCGAGAIGLSIAKLVRHSTVIASDSSVAAVETARANAKYNQVANVEFLEGNGLSPILSYTKDTRFDAIVANPPDRTPGEVDQLIAETRFEPRHALTSGGRDPLRLHRQIIRGARKLLKPGGFLAFEVHTPRADEVAALLKKAKYNVTSLPATDPAYPTTVIADIPRSAVKLRS